MSMWSTHPYTKETDAIRKAYMAFSTFLFQRSRNLESDAKHFLDALSEGWILPSSNHRRGGVLRHYLVKKMRNLRGMSATDGDAFQFFSSEEYVNHPWHNYSRIIQGISTNLDNAIADLHTFCCDTFILHNSGEEIDFTSHRLTFQGSFDFSITIRDNVTDDDVKAGISKVATALTETAEKLRSIIQPMQGTYYAKSWAVKIAMKYDRNTTQRGDAIRDMAANNRIPQTGVRLLSNLIQQKEKNIFFVDDEWKSVGNNRKRGLKLALSPIETTRGFPGIMVALYRPPKQICLRDYFGMKRDVRLYFSPRQFPTPTELPYGDICDSFDLLKAYIIEQSKKEGEVSSSGGKPGKSVRFSCKTKSCKFYFFVKWDKYGYYIHHHNYARDKFVGCMDHNHSR